MITRFLLTTLMMGTAFSAALPAYAQVTDQTDQSEEDWRKSRKKSGTTDIFKPNTRKTGSGAPDVDYKPISPVERLPSESRRHLMKERAKAIAESEDGDISDAEYVPSDAAQGDEDLMRDEKKAWDVIVTDMQGSGGSGAAGQGENKVAVAGQGGGGTSTGPRGGSTRTLQEIMDAIKNGGVAGGSGQAPTGPQQGNGPADGRSSDGQATQVADAGSASGGGATDGSGSNAGDAQADGSAQAGGEASGTGQDSGQDGSGDQSGDQGASGDQGDTGAQGEAADTAARAQEPLSPLDRMRKSREDRPARGTRRSASDYLGSSGND